MLVIKIKICMISKYPPIEGGVSSDTYWLAKGLGEIGHDVFVVSNCWEVEEKYREIIEQGDLRNLEPKNVHLFSTDPNEKYIFIPYFNPYDIKLTSLTLNIIKKYNPDILYAHYLLPYGVSAFISKKIVNKPFIIRHAGSDIARLFDSKFLRPFFIEVFNSADKIITGGNNAQKLSEFGIDSKKFVNIHRLVDCNGFNPNIKPFDLSQYTERDVSNISIFTYIGKISRLKNTHQFIEAASRIKDENFILLFVTEIGENLERLKGLIKNSGIENKTVFLPFKPPWKIASIMNISTCVICPENNEVPYLPQGTHFPLIAREAMMCGKCVILGNYVYEKYRKIYTEIQDGINVISTDTNNINKFSEKMKSLINSPEIAYEIGRNATKEINEKTNFSKYINSFVNLCNQIII